MNKGAKAPLLITMNYVYYIELMDILYWFLGYLGCGILFMFLAPLIVWAIDKYEIKADIFFEKSTYTEKWNYMYNDFPKLMIIILWPAFILVALVVLCKDLPEIIRFLLGKKQRYIDYVNKKAALIMKE